MTELPKTGEKIEVEKFHISECNVRYGEPFGETEEDREFKENLKFGAIRFPMEARPEGEGYGIYIGRRRYYGKKDYTTHFTVGADVLIFDVSEEEARERSFIENNAYLRKNMNPINYAEQLNLLVSRGGGGIRATARRVGIGASTVVDYLKLLELNQKIREQVRKGVLSFKDARTLARMKLGKEIQEKLGEVVEAEGKAGLQIELQNLEIGKKKRGIPKDKYIIVRMTFDRRWKEDLSLYRQLEKKAKQKNMKIDEYVKWVLQENVKES